MHHVSGIEGTALDEGFREAEGHAGVIGELAGLEVEGAATDHAGDRGEGAGWREFECGAKGVADGEAEEAAAIARLQGDGHGGGPRGRGLQVVGGWWSAAGLGHRSLKKIDNAVLTYFLKRLLTFLPH